MAARERLSDAEIDALLARVRDGDDAAALERLVTALEPLVRATMYRIRARQVDPDFRSDLLQEGRLALVMAARKYRPVEGHHFLRYAAVYIRGAMLECAAKRAVVHANFHARRKPGHIRLTLEALDQLHDRDGEKDQQAELVDFAAATPYLMLHAAETVYARAAAERDRLRLNGDFLRIARERAGLTQAELGLRIGAGVRISNGSAHCALIVSVESGKAHFSQEKAEKAMAILAPFLPTRGEIDEQLAREREADAERERLLAVLTPDAIRSARTALGLSLSMIAALMFPGRERTAVPKVHGWERGQRRPRLEDARRLYAILEAGLRVASP